MPRRNAAAQDETTEQESKTRRRISVDFTDDQMAKVEAIEAKGIFAPGVFRKRVRAEAQALIARELNPTLVARTMATETLSGPLALVTEEKELVSA